MTTDTPYFPSRRDYFAGLAMQAMISTASRPCLNGLDGMEHVTSHAAFRMADEMCGHEETSCIESALASAEPVAWSRTDDIADDDGCPIGTDEPRVVWGSEHPDPSETWFPLYGEPMLVMHDAQPAAKGESLGDGLRDYPYLIGLAKVLRMRGDPENANALDSVAERIRRTAPTPASVPDEISELRIVAKRNLASMINRGSFDKELMLKCLEELS